MDPIGSFSGLASGVQWRDMVDQIMEMEKSRRLAPVTSQKTSANKRRDAWTEFSSLLSGVTNAAANLRNTTAFKAFSTSVARSATTSKELLTASTSTSAAPGSYSVEVRALAQSEKLRSTTGFSSTSDALNLSGEILVNGRAVTLAAGDSLASIRDKINAVNSGTTRSGVTASIVTVSATENYLTLTADNTGTRGIELVDSGDGSSANGVLKDLGILTGGQTANTSGANTQSMRFSSENTALSTMLGLSGPPNVAYISVGGNRVQVDLANDTVQEVLDRIRAAGSEAEIVKEEVGGKSYSRISTEAVAVDTGVGNDQVASKRIIELLGFVKGGRTSQTQAGVNSEVVIDGLTVQRRTNTVTDAVAGVTLDLKVAEIGTKVAVNVTRNLDSIVGSVEEFTKAFNKLIDFQTAQRNPDAALYADASLRSSITALKRSIQTDVAGIDPTKTTYTRAAVAGVAFTREGKLAVDATTLKSALNTNFSEVVALFSTSASGTTADIRSITGTDKTASGTHAVNITQAAAAASATGTANFPLLYSPGADQMTVLDSYTGKSAVISLAFGTTIDAVVSSLNDEFGSEGMTLTASKSGSRLVIEGSKVGSAASFTVSYQRTGANYAGTTHPGLNAGTYAGLDVAGTIDGQAATGSGQTLTGAAGTGAEGLSFTYTGSATGAVGSINYGHGMAGELDRIIQGYTRVGDGLISLYVEGIDRSLTALGRREEAAQSRLDMYEERLVKQFTAMETALSMMNSQSSWLSAQMTSLESMNRK